MSNRIDKTLETLKQQQTTAIVPFITVGFPNISTSKEVAKGILDAGANMLELGVPFSDPLADGATIQMTSFKALENGVNIHSSLDMVRHLRNQGINAPLIFLGYLNPFIHYGFEKLAEEAQEAGLDGMIIPDLPPDEASPYQSILEDRGLYLIPLLAPTSTDERIKKACDKAKGFIYCVSLTGVTQARQNLSSKVEHLVKSIRLHTKLPILVGFGVSTHEHVEFISRFAEGAVVGSALLNSIDSVHPKEAVNAAARFIRDLRNVPNN